METSLNQIYQVEKEMLEQKSKYEQYFSNEVMCKQNMQIFEFSLESLKDHPDHLAVYQPLGKAFLRRSKEALAVDLKSLLEGNQKNLEEAKKMKEHFEIKKTELEKQLLEMTKTLKIA